MYDRATSNLTLIWSRHLGRHDRATPEVSQTLRSKWRDCVEGSVAIVLWEGRDCVAGSGTPVPPATAITTTPIMYATKKAIYVFTTFYIYLILRCSTVGRWRSLVLSLLVSPTYAPCWYLPRTLHVDISHVRSMLVSPTYAPFWYLPPMVTGGRRAENRS